MAKSLLGFDVPDGIILVNAQNVLDYWMENPAYAGVPWENWPSGLIPPWPRCLVEFVWDGHECAVGVLCDSSYERSHPKENEGGHALYLKAMSRTLALPSVDLVAVLTDDGGSLGMWGVPRGWRIGDGTIGDLNQGTDGEQQNMAAVATVALLTFLFSNCRNVTVHDSTPALSRQQRRHGPPAITYKVLDIAPMTRVLHDEGDIEHNGIKKALHICRGHFSHYTSEKPLFGKYEGTFWTPMHLRGSAEHGIVVKDYQVEPRDDLP